VTCARLGGREQVSAQDCYLAGLRGALCGKHTRQELRQIGEAFDWAALCAAGQP
jgi:hypothetical protein